MNQCFVYRLAQSQSLILSLFSWMQKKEPKNHHILKTLTLLATVFSLTACDGLGTGIEDQSNLVGTTGGSSQNGEQEASEDGSESGEEPATLAPMTVQFSTVHDVLVNQCLFCHSSINSSGGVNFDSYQNTLATVVPGDLSRSPLYQAVLSGAMPRNSDPLADSEIQLIQTWIEEGARMAEDDVLPTYTYIQVRASINQATTFIPEGLVPYRVDKVTKDPGIKILGVKDGHVHAPDLEASEIVSFIEFDLLMDRSIHVGQINGVKFRLDNEFLNNNAGVRKGYFDYTINGDLNDCFDLVLDGSVPPYRTAIYIVGGTQTFCVPKEE